MSDKKKDKVTPIRKDTPGAKGTQGPIPPRQVPRGPNLANDPELLKSIIGSQAVDIRIYSQTVVMQQQEIEGLKAQIIQNEAALKGRDEEVNKQITEVLSLKKKLAAGKKKK